MMDRKKYVFEASDDVKKVMAMGVTRGGAIWTDTMDVENFEELNSDYINDHYGQLQDEAYKRGFEDGKWKNEDGCTGCEWEGTPFDTCETCCNNYKNQWTAKKQDDEIKVGDEVTHKSDSVVWKAVCIQIDGDGRHMNLMGHTGAVGYYPVDDFKKTGRHFDIDKILEDMRE